MDELEEFGLSNYDIAATMDKVPNFLGVFMDDEFPAKIKATESGVVNYQDSSESGSHWVAYYNRKGWKYVCYYDPLGFPPTESMKRYLKTAAKPILYNPDHQQANEWACGVYSMAFIKQMVRSKSPYDTYYLK